MITALCDEYPKVLARHREIFVGVLLLVIYICALPTTTYVSHFQMFYCCLQVVMWLIFRVVCTWFTWWMSMVQACRFCSWSSLRRPVFVGSMAQITFLGILKRCLATGQAYFGGFAGNTSVHFFFWCVLLVFHVFILVSYIYLITKSAFLLCWRLIILWCWFLGNFHFFAVTPQRDAWIGIWLPRMESICWLCNDCVLHTLYTTLHCLQVCSDAGGYSTGNHYIILFNFTTVYWASHTFLHNLQFSLIGAI